MARPRSPEPDATATSRILMALTGTHGVNEADIVASIPGLRHLDDDHAFAADVGQVDEHQRSSLDGT